MTAYNHCPLCNWDPVNSFGYHARECLNPELWPAVQALKDENERLKDWKESAIACCPPMQEIAEELSIQLGESIHDKILPGIRLLKARIAKLEQQLAAPGDDKLRRAALDVVSIADEPDGDRFDQGCKLRKLNDYAMRLKAALSAPLADEVQ